jgi:hypothetical protein
MHQVKFGFKKVRITPQIAVWIEDTAGTFLEKEHITTALEIILSGTVTRRHEVINKESGEYGQISER